MPELTYVVQKKDFFLKKYCLLLEDNIMLNIMQ